MTKTEHLQFLALMLPTFIILLAAAVSLADLALPATSDSYSVAAAEAALRTGPSKEDAAYE
jgi:hypothetical protein